MNENKFLDALTNIDGELVERFVEYDERSEKLSKRKRNIRWGSLVACVVLIVCACIPILRWIVLPVPPVYENANYSAFEIGEFFICPKNSPISKAL